MTSLHEPESRQIRVLLVEDDRPLRLTMAKSVALSPAMKCVGDFGDAQSALDEAVTLAPDVAVIDLKLPGLDGISLISMLKQLLPECDILVLTAHDDPDTIYSAIKAGARGYLLKTCTTKDLLRSIVDLREGESPMSPVIARKVLEFFRNGSAEHTPRSTLPLVLSSREEGILALIAKGHVIKELPDLLEVTEATIRFHLRQIYKKLHVNNLTHAVLKYLDVKAR